MTISCFRRTWARTRLVCAALLATAACAVNPVTGQRQLALISEAQEIELGREAAREVGQSIGLVDNAGLQEYVHPIGVTLAKTSERPELPWSFRVVDDPSPNAFALPGGFIFVTRGMMSLMDSEAELASVLGHEIGHVTARHSVTQISRQQLAQIGLGVGGALLPEIRPAVAGLGAGLQLLFLKHGRDAERQADELGFRYAKTAGYDISEMADVFVSLQRIGDGEGRSTLPSWLATHPAPAERVEAVRQRIAELGKQAPGTRRGRDEYLDRIDGMVYGDDPRQGFFRANVFYHPSLRFQLTVPEKWQTANLARAVMAGSPEGDAVAQLTLAGDIAPAQATRQFLNQQGVGAVRSTQENINGIPAVVTLFEAQTSDGPAAGYLAYLEYDNRTYQLLAYARAGAFDRWERSLAGTIRSFEPLTDRRLLEVQPRRLDVVRLDRAMSLADFARAYPSSIPLEILATLNQVASPDTVLPAGTLVKRVVGENPAGEGQR